MLGIGREFSQLLSDFLGNWRAKAAAYTNFELITIHFNAAPILYR